MRSRLQEIVNSLAREWKLTSETWSFPKATQPASFLELNHTSAKLTGHVSFATPRYWGPIGQGFMSLKTKQANLTWPVTQRDSNLTTITVRYNSGCQLLRAFYSYMYLKTISLIMAYFSWACVPLTKTKIETKYWTVLFTPIPHQLQMVFLTKKSPQMTKNRNRTIGLWNFSQRRCKFVFQERVHEP